PVPLSVSVKDGPPAETEFGLKLVSVGTGLLTVNVTLLDVPPPGAGLKTVTCAVPATAMSPAGICAVNCVELTKVVGRSAPFQRTTEPLMKFVPVTVKVKAAPPVITAFGFKLVSVGAG